MLSKLPKVSFANIWGAGDGAPAAWSEAHLRHKDNALLPQLDGDAQQFWGVVCHQQPLGAGDGPPRQVYPR